LKFHCSCATFLLPDPDDDIAEGQTVLVIGNPEGLQGTVSNALVAAIREDQNRIQFTAPISRGSKFGCSRNSWLVICWA
jgi:S1-C subfamily serine protease